MIAASIAQAGVPRQDAPAFCQVQYPRLLDPPESPQRPGIENDHNHQRKQPTNP
jgi:hypothetical protein